MISYLSHASPRHDSIAHAHTQDVFNDPKYNPTSGCSQPALCDGAPGLFVVLEVKPRSCDGRGNLDAGYLSPGEIAGIVIGSVAGMLILIALMWWLIAR